MLERQETAWGAGGGWGDALVHALWVGAGGGAGKQPGMTRGDEKTLPGQQVREKATSSRRQGRYCTQRQRGRWGGSAEGDHGLGVGGTAAERVGAGREAEGEAGALWAWLRGPQALVLEPGGSHVFLEACESPR